jgi:hypothetical protein
MNDKDAFSSRDRWRKANRWEQDIPDERLADIFDPMEGRRSMKLSSVFTLVFGLFTFISVYALCLYAVSSILEWDFAYFKCFALSTVFCVFRYTDAGVMKQVNER